VEREIATDIPKRAVELFLEADPRTVALAGGSTPRATYEALAQAPRSWAGTDVFFGDERCVDADDPDSNFRMATESLLRHVPDAKVHPMTGCDPVGYAATLGTVFASTSSVPRFDLVFLGLGSDGHTASLFPGDAALDITDRWVAQVVRPDHERLTLTLPVLCAAKLVIFLVSGAAKVGPLRLLMDGGDIPAARVQAERVIVLADPAAAGEEPGP